jgi:hypothetical protein
MRRGPSPALGEGGERSEAGEGLPRSSVKLTNSHCTLRLIEADRKSRGEAGSRAPDKTVVQLWDEILL